MSLIHQTYPGPPPPLEPGDVHVWFAEFARCSPGVTDCLSADEQVRAVGYKLPRVRDQFATGRGVLRSILSGYLRTPPEAIVLIADADGKPRLSPPFREAVHFNVSHSAGMGLFAVSNRPVGVDLEPIRIVENASGLVERFFAAEERASYAALPESDRKAGFLRGWTCKEALLKAVGSGMRRMEECAVEMDPGKPPRVIRLDGAGADVWAIETWTPFAGFVAAVAYQ
ncbi:MAG TPA: 4'-phosphopantetheinyl transferase superfamily protein [Fimbriiglobus sp.]|jgi:4'-phosphopantetheinyl transferase